MKIILDSNVFIAAFAVRGLCWDVFRYCRENEEIALSEEILAEVEKGFTRKLKMPVPDAKLNIEFIRAHGKLFTPADVPKNSCRDPKDIHVLGLGLTAKARCVVSGDDDLLALKSFRDMSFLSPRQFWLAVIQAKGSQLP